MDANSKKLLDAVRRKFGQLRGSFPEFVVCCPFCNDRRWRFGINVAKQLAHCFNCDERLSPSRLQELLGLREVFDATDFDVLEAELEALGESEFSEGFPDRPRADPTLLRGLLFSDVDESSDLYYTTIKQLTWQHLESRGFDPDKVAADYRLMAPSPETFKNPRVILPIYENGAAVFYQARSLDQGQPKYLNPRKEALQGKANYVFNLDRVDPASEVLICEGIFSAIAAGPQAVAVLGKTISLTQLFKLLSRGVDRATILFDPGAELQAFEASNLLRGALDVKVAFLESGDPNEVDPDYLAAVVQSAQPIDSFDFLGD